MKYRKILLAYNGSKEGKLALLDCADLAGFLQAAFGDKSPGFFAEGAIGLFEVERSRETIKVREKPRGRRR